LLFYIQDYLPIKLPLRFEYPIYFQFSSTVCLRIKDLFFMYYNSNVFSSIVVPNYYRDWVGYGFYKEPGNSGFDVNDPSMQMHLKSCVNIETGEPIDCTMEPGMQYPKYSCDGSGDCNIMEPCPDETSQMDCTTLTTNKDKTDCENDKKWCRKYTIETVAENETLGYIPVTSYCQDAQGRFTQELGQAYDLEGGDTVGNCYWGDGVTLVNRTLAGDYAYCDGAVCDNTFSGSWYSEEFDPRYRIWYTQTKEMQVPNWSPPYVFTTREIGISHSHPIYTTMEDGRQRFHGVLAIDYRCTFVPSCRKHPKGTVV
jgi:hypothetical protein